MTRSRVHRPRVIGDPRRLFSPDRIAGRRRLRPALTPGNIVAGFYRA